MRAHDEQLEAAPRRSPAQRVDTGGASSLASAMLGLNQTAGNAAAARAVQRSGGTDDEFAGADGGGAAPGLGASAYTGGSDIAFGGGGGDDLMAHEASHVTQQGPGNVGGAPGAGKEEEE